MANGIFIHREDSRYRDSPAERYHFPRQYLARVQRCIGDWIVYYEPVKVPGTRGYWAVARVADVVPDAEAKGMYYARIAPGDFVEFSHPVPRVVNGAPVERDLVNAQWAVRPLSRADFARVVSLGLPDEEDLLPRADVARDNRLQEERAAFDYGDVERPRVLTSRAHRDRAFRSAVLRAYDSRCAFTGLKLINGGGRAEVEAAHIKPVSAGGPDSISNGLALSGTVHWMFDRGLLSLGDDLSILVSRQVNDHDGLAALLNRTGKAALPAAARDRPHPHFLEWHRANCFKH